ncbi:MAG: N-acetyltransferase family protein [Thermoanaerobaculia bacterium]
MEAAPSVSPARVEDVPAVQSIAERTWKATYADLIPGEVQARLLATWYSTAALEGQIRAGETIFLVARWEEEPVGFAQFVRLSSAEAALLRIYVLPEFQNRSVGSALLSAGLAKLRERGIGKLTVEVERENRIGRRFYRQRSFTDVGESIADFAGHEVALVKCELAI